MPVKIISRNSDSVEIKWTFKFLGQTGQPIKKSFDLGDFLCTPKLQLSFNYHIVKVDDLDELCEADIFLSLKQIPSVKSSATGNKISNYHQRPSAVRFMIDEKDEMLFMQPSTVPWNFPTKWMSDTFLACKFSRHTYAGSAGNQQKSWIFHHQQNTAHIQFKIWIEFTDSFSKGPSNTLKHLTRLYIDQKYCDVQFLFRDGSSIGGHTCILAARSPVFAAMFNHEMEESKSSQVQIEDIESNTFSHLLHYIYCGRTMNFLDDTAQSLYTVADKYDIEDLKEECVSYLLSNIRINNAINLFIWGYLHSVCEVQGSALNFMTENSREICLQDEWVHLLNNYPELSVTATRLMIK